MKTSIFKKILIINLAAIGAATQALALHPGEPAAVIACGKLESFSGSVQVFDASRTTVIDVGTDMKLQCGDWVSVTDGKAQIKHNLGFQVTLGAGSFMQILDPHAGDNPDQDHFALYRGQAVFKNAAKKPSMSVATANARAKFSHSEGYLLYSSDFLVTQLVGMNGTSDLENRFLDVRPVKVGRSQVTSMGELESRPVPRRARPVSMASIRERLARIGVSQDLQKQMLEKMKVLVQTNLPVKLAVESHEPERSLASVENQDESTPNLGIHAPESMASYELSHSEPENAPVVQQNHSARPVARATRKIAVASRHTEKSALSKEEIEKQRLLKKLSEIEVE